MTPVVGIDLGTTSSRVAFMQGGAPVILENSEGEGTTPSYIAITPEGDRLVGEEARRYAMHDPKNVAFAAKRFIGRKFSDPIVRQISRFVPYEIIEGKNGDAWVRLNGEDYSPIQLSAFVLQKMKQTAELYFGEPVRQAVITVPAYFNLAQRQATKDAGRIAGLEVLRMINEPTAAALAYGFPWCKPNESRTETIAVYDLGGGTFDVSILELCDGTYVVKATSGDMHLGGEDIDFRIAQFLAEDFKSTHHIDISQSEIARQRLKHAAELAKIELSASNRTLIDLPFIHFDGRLPLHLQKALRREEMEALINDLTQRTIDVCKHALKDADLKPNEIDHVVLVGGSTRMPCIKVALEGLFGPKLYGGLRREDAVALGAAVQGGVLKGEVKGVLLLDACSFSLGIETLGGVVTRLIDRNTTIPTKKSQIFTATGVFPEISLLELTEEEREKRETARACRDKKGRSPYPDSEGVVLIRVVQGEQAMAKDNHTLGRFVLSGIPSQPAELPLIEITIDIDTNGLVDVRAKDKITYIENAITVRVSSGFQDDDFAALTSDVQSRPVLSKELRRGVSLGAGQPAITREVANEAPPVSVAIRHVVPASPAANRPAIFVSYAHEDAAWARSLERALSILTRQNRIDLFIDHHLRTGEEWQNGIFRAIEEASAAILLFSNNFFSSDFIMSRELPILLARYEHRDMSLLPIIVRPCPFDLYDEVNRFQAFNDPQTPLSKMPEWQVDEELARLAREIARA